jgi:hypothetical protein
MQLPLMHTSDWSEGENLLNLSVKIAKCSSIHLECDIDRSVEVHYSTSDTIDILLAPKFGIG